MKGFRTLLTATTLVLGACGGSSSSSSNSTPPPGPSPAAGIYNGLTDQGQEIGGIVLTTGEFYFLYSAPSSSLLAGLDGVVNGSSSASGGNFTSSDALDYTFTGDGILEADVTATFTSGQNLTGDVEYQLGTVGFTTSYQPESTDDADLAGAAGTWEGTAETLAGSEAADVVITAGGQISGQSASGCTFEGTIQARSADNAFDVEFTFDGSATTDCAAENAGKTLRGIAHHDTTEDGLLVAAKTDDRQTGAFFVGVPATP